MLVIDVAVCDSPRREDQTSRLDNAVTPDPGDVPEPANDADNRSSKRTRVIRTAKIIHDNATVHCLLVSVSETGARIRLHHDQVVPDTVTLVFSDGLAVTASRRWTRRDEVGFSFDMPSTQSRGVPGDGRAGYLALLSSLTETSRRLASSDRFDDPAIEHSVEQAKVAIQRLQDLLETRTRTTVE